MPRVTKGVLWSEVEGQKVALSQTYGADGEPQLVSEDTPMPVKGTMQLSGSIVAINSSGQIVSNNVAEYRGLSTDTKPTNNVALHSTFLEMDTGAVFYWGGTEWSDF